MGTTPPASRFTLALILGCVAALLAATAASAQDYPTKPITLIVGYAAGVPTDVIARIVAQDMAASLGQSVVVQNKPGANSLIATLAVARAAPDGYTLLAASHSHSVNPLLLESARYDPVKSFTPVSLVAALPLLLVTYPDAPFSSVHDLVSAAKARPGEVTYASAGYGGSAHLAGALLTTLSGVQLTHVAISGNAPALMEVIAARVSFMFYPMVGVAGNVSQHRLKVLAVGADKRHPDFPSVPTMAEAGFRGFHETAPWVGILAPAGTPEHIAQRLNNAVRSALAKPQTQQRLRELGADTIGTSRGEFDAFLQQDTERWGRLIRVAGVEKQ